MEKEQEEKGEEILLRRKGTIEDGKGIKVEKGEGTAGRWEKGGRYERK